ncbi:GPI mannosyltransferase 1 [Leucoagaricus sp. SymC.cos]|nr:GPI mannosyltransferase 1 [Leucoagaricus sp. SymC.cos]
MAAIPIPSFRNVLLLSVGLRVALILYSEWHDARSLVKYTDIDYRVFTDAARFILQPSQDNKAQGPPYTRHTYRYTPLLALLLTPNIFLHPSFGKYIFAACDIINGLLIYNLLMNHILPSSTTRTSTKTLPSAIDGMRAKATLYTTVHLLNPMVFSISTRGSSESVISLFVLLILHALFNERWTTAALFLGLSTHWKIYPVIYGVSCVCLIGSLNSSIAGHRGNGLMGWFKVISHAKTIKFATVSAVAFSLLGTLCYTLWGYPFLYESYLYHLHRLDHRHNFSPYFYPTYLSYPPLNLSLTPTSSHRSSFISILTTILSSPLTSFLPQLLISLGSGFLSLNPLRPENAKIDIPLTWFIQTFAFVLFNKVCTSQYFLWYFLLFPLLLPNLHMSRSKALACVGVWIGVQALWLSEAYKLEFLGEDVFLGLWFRGLVYIVGNAWVLIVIMESYKA